MSGLNISQVDGDYFTGWDQSGLSAGIQVDALMTSHLRLSVGMLYNQKGSQIPHGSRVTSQTSNDRNVRLNYIDVPILLKVMLNHPERGSFLEIGGSFGRLASTQITERLPTQFEGTVYKEIVSQFNKNEFGLIGGLGFTIGKRIALRWRYNFGVTRFYYNEGYIAPRPLSTAERESRFLRNYFMSIHASYRVL